VQKDIKSWTTQDGNEVFSALANTFTFDYYNTTSSNIISCVLSWANLAFSANLILNEYIADYEYTSSVIYPKVDDFQASANTGSYFWDYRTDTLYTHIDPGTGGFHKSFFADLVAKGIFDGVSDHLTIPRGITKYQAGNNIYVVVGGDWLTKGIAEDICEAFGYDHVKYPWGILRTNVYALKTGAT